MAKLSESVSQYADAMSVCAESGKAVTITTHADCDGIAAGAITAKSLIRAGVRCSVHAIGEMNSEYVKTMRKGSLHVISDMGSSFAGEFESILDEDWFVMDHHEISDTETDNARVINAWKFGINGSSEACSASMAYIAAVRLDSRNTDLAAMAIVGALGDRQDQGDKRSLLGKNLEISAKAQETSMLDVSSDLLLAGRTTRTLRDALAATTRPFIDGLTWNHDACETLIEKAQIRAKDGERWRVASELNHEEKSALIDAIVAYAPESSADAISSELVGYAYTLLRESETTPLRDAREFATVVNSCTRVNKTGVGVALCMGDRTMLLADAQESLEEYRKLVKNCMERISSERWRMTDKRGCIMVNAEGVVEESMTGSISSVIAGAPASAGKIVVLRAGADDGRIKLSSRKSRGCGSDVNLSDIMRGAATRFEGTGGGHSYAASARISKNNLGAFLEYVEENVSKVQRADSHS